MTDQQAFSVHKWEYVNGTVVAYSTEGVMRDADWDSTLQALRTAEPLFGYLGTSIGSVEVSGSQRKAAVEVMKGRAKPTAIVTKSRLVIGLATAASWLGASIKAFSWQSIDEATEFLGIPAAQRQPVIDAVLRLRDQAEAEADAAGT